MLHLKEASEVSERLDLPKLHQCKTLNQVLEELKESSQKVIFAMSLEKICIYLIILTKNSQRRFHLS